MDREQRDKILDGMVDRMRFLHAVWDLGEVVKKFELYDALKKTGVSVDDFAYILIATMCYLMSQGIHDRKQETPASAIRSFLLTLPELGVNHRNVDVLLRYVVNVSLQNEGALRTHDVLDARRGEKSRVMSKMLVKGFDGVRLDEDGYDVLFRSREYADQYNFNAREHLLHLACENREYGQAKRESLELLNIATSALKRSEAFQARVRADVLSVNPGDYEKYRSLADSAKGSREKLGKLQKWLQRPLEDLVEGADALSVELRDEQSQDIAYILENIKRTILVLEMMERVVAAFVKEHEDLVIKSMAIERRRGIDIRKTFIVGALNLNAEGVVATFDLMLNRLCAAGVDTLPTPSRIFGMSAPKMRDSEDETEEFEDEPVFIEKEDAKARAKRKTTEFIGAFLPWLKEVRTARLSDFIAQIDEQTLCSLTEEKALPNILLNLYRAGSIPLPVEVDRDIDIASNEVEENNYEKLFEAIGVVFEPGECLRLRLTDDEISWSSFSSGDWMNVRMTDFECMVVKHDEPSPKRR